ncbi:longitudinals lacking protein, isoforms H/M/V-like isoform X35 [Bacillus rossius redtenbacheri]|uniref:longitudinals lacking protein, isoforms H/M/V-like isoform X35 n=1 Tax=Bacillus rossius redtenbacheri TaxID=93214 RepID=UPI002FDE4A4F
MASEQQFCLRWNNHQSTLVSVFDTLLESGTLVDCTLAAEGQYLKAHKVVLSACSPYFELLLSQHYEKHPIIILKDVKFQELKAMMDYMYRGEVNISQDQLGALLKAAESLQIKGLSDSGGGGTEKEEPAEKYVEDKKPVTAPVRTSQSAAHNSGLTIERRRSAPVDSTEDDSQPLPKGMSSREGSSSPVPRKRKKQRRRSSGGEAGGESNALQDSHDQTSSSSERSQPVPNMSQSLPASIATVPSSVKSSGETDQKLVNAEVFPTRTSHSQPSIPREPDVVQKVEPPAEVLLEPKAEYLDEDVNEDSVEDLTLDDDDDLDMSMDHAQPGPSHGGEGSSQGYLGELYSLIQRHVPESFTPPNPYPCPQWAPLDAANLSADTVDSLLRSLAGDVMFRKYSVQHVMQALEAVLKRGSTVSHASLQFGIKRSTLQFYLKKLNIALRRPVGSL